MRNDPSFGPLEGRFMDKMRTIAKEYSSQLSNYDIHIDDQANVTELIKIFSDVSIQAFAASECRDFFLLHGVTAMRSAKTLIQYLEDKKTQLQLLRDFWRALIAVYIAQGRPHVQPMNISDADAVELSWKDIIQRALAQDDVHKLKIVFVCHEENKEYGNTPLYLHIANTTLAVKEWKF